MNPTALGIALLLSGAALASTPGIDRGTGMTLRPGAIQVTPAGAWPVRPVGPIVEEILSAEGRLTVEIRKLAEERLTVVCPAAEAQHSPWPGITLAIIAWVILMALIIHSRWSRNHY